MIVPMKEFKLHGIYFSGLLRIYEVIRQNVNLFPVRNMYDEISENL